MKNEFWDWKDWMCYCLFLNCRWWLRCETSLYIGLEVSFSVHFRWVVVRVRYWFLNVTMFVNAVFIVANHLHLVFFIFLLFSIASIFIIVIDVIYKSSGRHSHFVIVMELACWSPERLAHPLSKYLRAATSRAYAYRKAFGFRVACSCGGLWVIFIATAFDPSLLLMIQPHRLLKVSIENDLLRKVLMIAQEAWDLGGNEVIEQVVGGRDRVLLEEVDEIDALLDHLEEHHSDYLFQCTAIKVIAKDALDVPTGQIFHLAFDKFIK